ncbi:hypothetical protein C922_05612 [Plasmodium inui San Antonio 1]|uniref:Uncharacterized protein n=1 Tax=Plasmodium inui San Antonio 1 TaxID=1237626 RepID=W6ZXI9_9APIC|nr:hypothetical protein C922_05612 [Plasmodium inui San Antonio 1]EUD64008.1 hypothetical protein C922_05612 [Plasmodium inui San Antonio 1]
MIFQGEQYYPYDTTFRIMLFLKKCYGRYITGFGKIVMSLYYSQDLSPFKNKVPEMRTHQCSMNNGFIQITERPMVHPPYSNIRGTYLQLTTYYWGYILTLNKIVPPI